MTRSRAPEAPARLLLTADEVAVRLECSRPTVYRLHREGKLQAIRVGKAALRFHPEDVDLVAAGMRGDGILATGDVAALLGVSVQTVHELLRAGELRPVREGRSGVPYLFERSEVDRYLREARGGAA